MRLLLLSNSTNEGQGYLDHVMPAVRRWLGASRRLVFVPFAINDQAGYVRTVRDRMAKEGVEVDGLTEDAEGKKLLETAEAVFVGGGNTFRLLDRLQRSGARLGPFPDQSPLFRPQARRSRRDARAAPDRVPRGE